MYDRFTLYPIKYPQLYDLYNKQAHAFWVKEEIDLHTDVVQWRNVLKDEDRKFLGYILSFFAQADGIVLKNLNVNFSIETDIPEANLFFGIQAGIEAIHWDTYSLLIETLINQPDEKKKAFEAIQNYSSIKQKADWILSWMDPTKNSLAERLVAFACTEGIFFSSAFAGIFYYKKKGLLPGLIMSNEFIARDEGLHRDFGCELLKLDKLPENTLEIIKQSVEIECCFVKESLQLELIGMKAEQMCQYVKFVADNLLSKLGMRQHYNIENPFSWMNMISLTGKDNFFERQPTNYKKSTVNTEFTTDAEF